MQLMVTGDIHKLDPVDMEALGVEGLEPWKENFAPKEISEKVNQVRTDWVNFVIMALLNPEKFVGEKVF